MPSNICDLPARAPRVQVEVVNDAFRLVPPREEFRILQVTDIHVSHRYFSKRGTFETIRQMCEKFAVDLVVNTGDFFCRNATFLIKWVVRDFDRIVGSWCPWTFAWGNHDCDNFGKGNLAKADKIETFLQGLPNCLYRQTRRLVEQRTGLGLADDPREQEAFGQTLDPKHPRDGFDGFYGGNFALEVLGPATMKPALDLYMLNSRRWHHVPPKALVWVEEHANRFGGRANTLPSLVFYHVPNVEFHRLWEQGAAQGIKREAVCFEKDDGRVHQFLARLGSVKGVFVGHDHVNDYWFDLDGIRYAYGRKTGIGAYGGMLEDPGDGVKGIKIGATLITVKLGPGQFSFEHQTVFPDGSTWKAGA